MRLDSKQFKNEACQACIKKNIAKYGRFDCKCDGITVEQDVKFALKKGVSEEDARFAYDPNYFFQTVYGHKPRWYQEPILACTSRNMISRQCRQSGKTLAVVYKIMQFVLTNKDKTVIILTPQEKQIKKIWDEYIYRDCLDKSYELKKSIVSSVQKPYYQVTFDNGSKIILMVANEGARGQTADWIYIDEAAMIGTEMINSILMTVASRGEDAVVLMTSTPKGRGNIFYKSCKEDSSFNEYHVPISVVAELSSQVPRFKKMLGETGFMQECEAEFPDVSGGPFNLAGITMAKGEYEYENLTRQDGVIYIGGVDWNGPSVGTYFYVIAFNPDNYTVTVVDKAVVASATWNSTVAKETLLRLNRKWRPKHWMCDYGYGHDLVENLRLYSMQVAPSLGNNHPDSQLKYILETVEFGAIMDIRDPFTKEEVKKTCKAFIVAQTSRLFEPNGGLVSVTFSKEDNELIECLENYQLLNVTARGFEQYGFDKKSGIEDHAIDAFMLAVYGIVKYYNELYKRIIYQSVPLQARDILSPKPDENVKRTYVGNIVLLTDNSPETIMLDDAKLRKPIEDLKLPFVSRSLDRNSGSRGGVAGRMHSRSGPIKRSF